MFTIVSVAEDVLVCSSIYDLVFEIRHEQIIGFLSLVIQKV